MARVPIRIRPPTAATAFHPRKRPLQDRSALTVDTIVEAAIRVLERDGWPALATTRVARRAGVSVGSLYQYFPNRESIVVELVRRRTRRLLEAVLAADLSGCTNPAEAATRLMAAFVQEKRTGLASSLAVRDALPAVQGRAVVVEEARRSLPALQDKLRRAGLGPAGPQEVALALVAIEGVAWELLGEDGEALADPGIVARLAGILLAALGALRP